jgi:hypothetical protein
MALFKRSDLYGVDKITTYILLKKLKGENLIKVIEEFKSIIININFY